MTQTTTDTRVNVIQLNDISLEDDRTPLEEESTVIPYTEDEIADMIFAIRYKEIVEEERAATADKSLSFSMIAQQYSTLDIKYHEYVKKRELADMTHDPVCIGDKANQLALFKDYIGESQYNEWETQLRLEHGEEITRSR